MKLFKSLILLGFGLWLIFSQYYNMTHNVWKTIGLCVITLIGLLILKLFGDWLMK